MIKSVELLWRRRNEYTKRGGWIDRGDRWTQYHFRTFHLTLSFGPEPEEGRGGVVGLLRALRRRSVGSVGPEQASGGPTWPAPGVYSQEQLDKVKRNHPSHRP